jgi:Carboxypeptidase regulatory-like domain/TonB dependent receptor
MRRCRHSAKNAAGSTCTTHVRITAVSFICAVCKIIWVAAFLLCTTALPADNAELSGLVRDPAGRPVGGASVSTIDRRTGTKARSFSNAQGIYRISSLIPGSYDITVEAGGFRPIHQTDVGLEVGQRGRLDFDLTIGSLQESITVNGSPPLLNSEDASVSTVIGHVFVENLPLNGRSFSSLIDLTPGVVLTPTNSSEQGQFSINGQRPDSNYFMMDGVSANLGSAGAGNGNQGQGGAGQLPATSIFGGTSNLAALDAIEEFRILTSTFAPEYGHTVGAQISVVTRSGSKTFHGSLSEYLRNDKLDANDWFTNGRRLARPELRQNDFGGTFGGPVSALAAKNPRLFFFSSFEGLIVRQPHTANTYVPSLSSRQKAPSALQPIINAFPLPTGPDLGNGTSVFSASYSDPSSLYSSGIRFDYLPSQRITTFGRFSDAISASSQRAASNNEYGNVQNVNLRTQSLTLGLNAALAPTTASELHFNYSRVRARSTYFLDDFGGATPPSMSSLLPSGAPAGSSFLFVGDSNPYGLRFQTGDFADNSQLQINMVGRISRVVGSHLLSVGVDYRRLEPENGVFPYQVQYGFLNLANVMANVVPVANVITRNSRDQIAFTYWSAFAQDRWNVSRSLTLTYGYRWEYNGSPTAPDGDLPFTVTGLGNLATMKLAPRGTPLWKARINNFAPRLGIAWHPIPRLVARIGGGIFFDTGNSAVANGMSAFPFAQSKALSNVSFPLSDIQAAPLVFTTSPPVSYLAVVDPDHALPETYEWNSALEASAGKASTLTLTYTGAAGRKLMRQDVYFAPNADFTGQFLVMSNNADSSYHAFEAEFRRRIGELQVLASYTWAHAIDNASSDAYAINVPGINVPSSQERGSSDYDIRQTLAVATSSTIQSPSQRVLKTLFGGWSTDAILYFRTAPPVNVVTGANPFLYGNLQTGANGAARPNLISGVPLWLSDPNIAGGRRINPAAFQTPALPVQGDLGRNTLRGFGAANVDLALRKPIRLREHLSLEIRADFFNVANHPAFGAPINYLTSPQFGQTTQTLSSALGGGGQNGGLNPIYQIGGPRRTQLSLRLLF